MRFLELLSLSFVALFAGACPDDDHGHSKREYPLVPLTPPTRQLEWGDINILHTTDTHGWLLGHQKTTFPEPNYSGDFGDFASFVAHMKALALEKDVDLLLVDSGDLHDGTGLSDGFPPGGVDAHESNKFILQLPYDIMAIGNHELYSYANTYDMYTNFAPPLQGRYLSSNVNITVFDEAGGTVSVPVGSRYRKFTTRKGRKVTSLGVLFDFTGNSVNTTVQGVEFMVNEAWFKEAIAEEPDIFVLAGHMPVRGDKWPLVFNAIRAVHATTPILILGGHTHIRDCVQLDGRSMALESGRYMETVGWLSADLGEEGCTENITFSRRYLDANRISYEYHSQQSNATFDTSHGRRITEGLEQLAQDFNLSLLYGTAPMDYTLTRVPYPSDNSILSLLVSQAMPLALSINNSRASIPNLMIANSGALRFDLFAGPFTKNDELTASPFTDAFLYIPNVTYGVASQVGPIINGQGSNSRRYSSADEEEELYKKGYVGKRFRKWLEDMHMRRQAMELERGESVATTTLGYVTVDACPGVGDDTAHEALPFYNIPDYIVSDPPSDITDDTRIDLVFVDFFETLMLTTLNSLQSEKNFTSADVSTYSPLIINQVLGVFAQSTWN